MSRNAVEERERAMRRVAWAARDILQAYERTGQPEVGLYGSGPCPEGTYACIPVELIRALRRQIRGWKQAEGKDA